MATHSLHQTAAFLDVQRGPNLHRCARKMDHSLHRSRERGAYREFESLSISSKSTDNVMKNKIETITVVAILEVETSHFVRILHQNEMV